jgi:hypothetical protein
VDLETRSIMKDLSVVVGTLIVAGGVVLFAWTVITPLVNKLWSATHRQGKIRKTKIVVLRNGDDKVPGSVSMRERSLADPPRD